MIQALFLKTASMLSFVVIHLVGMLFYRTIFLDKIVSGMLESSVLKLFFRDHLDYHRRNYWWLEIIITHFCGPSLPSNELRVSNGVRHRTRLSFFTSPEAYRMYDIVSGLILFLVLLSVSLVCSLLLSAVINICSVIFFMNRFKTFVSDNRRLFLNRARIDQLLSSREVCDQTDTDPVLQTEDEPDVDRRPFFLRTTDFVHYTQNPTSVVNPVFLLRTDTSDFVTTERIPYCREMLSDALAKYYTIARESNDINAIRSRLIGYLYNKESYNFDAVRLKMPVGPHHDCLVWSDREFSRAAIVENTVSVAFQDATFMRGFSSQTSSNMQLVHYLNSSWETLNRFNKRNVIRNGLAVLFLSSTIFATSVNMWQGYHYSRLPSEFQHKRKPVQNVGTVVKYKHFEKKTFGYSGSCPIQFSNFKNVLASPMANRDEAIDEKDAFEYRLNTLNAITNSRNYAAKMADLKNYALEFCRKYVNTTNFVDDVYDFISQTKYSAERKAKIILDHEIPQFRDSLNKIFIKRETYSEFKPPRIIVDAARTYKNIEGPIIAAADKCLDRVQGLLKGVPVYKWAEKVNQKFAAMPGQTYVTDFTSFESSIGYRMKTSVENVVIRHIVPTWKKALTIMERTQNLPRKVVGKFHNFLAPVCRFSGDQRTSFGNTMTNLIVGNYICDRQNIPHLMFACGDDGLIRIPHGFKLEGGFWTDLGLNIKLQTTEVNVSNFCGFRCAMTSKGYCQFADIESRIMDMCVFDQNMNKIKMEEMLRMKALSAFIETPMDPIVAPFSRVILETRKGNRMARNWWDEENLKNSFVEYTVGSRHVLLAEPSVREVVERLTGSMDGILDFDEDLYLSYEHVFRIDRDQLKSLQYSAIFAALSCDFSEYVENMRLLGLVNSDKEFYNSQFKTTVLECVRVDFAQRLDVRTRLSLVRYCITDFNNASARRLLSFLLGFDKPNEFQLLTRAQYELEDLLSSVRQLNLRTSHQLQLKCNA